MPPASVQGPPAVRAPLRAVAGSQLCCALDNDDDDDNYDDGDDDDDDDDNDPPPRLPRGRVWACYRLYFCYTLIMYVLK